MVFGDVLPKSAFLKAPPPPDPAFVYKGGYIFPRWVQVGGPFYTKEEAPYAYSVHVIRGPIKRFEGEGVEEIETDRLSQKYGDKWHRAYSKHMRVGPVFASLKSIGKALTETYGQKVRCLQVMEGCKISTGTPYWIFVTKKD
jgi:hypothetical protein